MAKEDLLNPTTLSPEDHLPEEPKDLLSFQPPFEEGYTPVRVGEPLRGDKYRLPGFDPEKYKEYTGDVYMPTGGVEAIQEMQSQLQPWDDLAMRGLGRFAAKTLTEVGKIPGYAVGGVGAIGTGDIRTMVDNAWVNFFEDIDESAKESFPVYASPLLETGSLWDSITSGSFWATDFSDALGFLVSMFTPGIALKAMGTGARMARGVNAAKLMKLGKPASLVDKVRKGAPLGTEDLKLLGQTGLVGAQRMEELAGISANTVFEAAAEAAGMVDNLKMQLGEKVKRGEISQEDADARIEEAGTNVFLNNIALLVLPNTLSYKAVMGKFSPFRSMGNRLKDPLTGKLVTEAPKLSGKAVAGRWLAALGAGAISEGAIEEGGQFAIEDYYHDKALGETDKGWLDGIIESYKEGWDTLEGQKAMFLGALLGGGMGTISTVRETKAFKKNANSVFNMLQVANLEFGANLTNLYKQEVYTEDGVQKVRFVLDENTKRPVIDPLKVDQYFKNIASGSLTDLYMQIGAMTENQDLYDTAFNDMFTKLVVPYARIDGGMDLLEGQLDQIAENMTSALKGEENIDLADHNSTIKAELLERAKSIAKDVNFISIYDNKYFKLKDPFKRYEEEKQNFIEKLKNAVITKSAEQRFHQDKINQHTEEIEEIETQDNLTEIDNVAIKEKKELVKQHTEVRDKRIQEIKDLLNKKLQQEAFTAELQLLEAKEAEATKEDPEKKRKSAEFNSEFLRGLFEENTEEEKVKYQDLEGTVLHSSEFNIGIEPDIDLTNYLDDEEAVEKGVKVPTTFTIAGRTATGNLALKSTNPEVTQLAYLNGDGTFSFGSESNRYTTSNPGITVLRNAAEMKKEAAVEARLRSLYGENGAITIFENTLNRIEKNILEKFEEIEAFKQALQRAINNTTDTKVGRARINIDGKIVVYTAAAIEERIELIEAEVKELEERKVVEAKELEALKKEALQYVDPEKTFEKDAYLSLVNDVIEKNEIKSIIAATKERVKELQGYVNKIKGLLKGAYTRYLNVIKKIFPDLLTLEGLSELSDLSDEDINRIEKAEGTIEKFSSIIEVTETQIEELNAEIEKLEENLNKIDPETGTIIQEGTIEKIIRRKRATLKAFTEHYLAIAKERMLGGLTEVEEKPEFGSKEDQTPDSTFDASVEIEEDRFYDQTDSQEKNPRPPFRNFYSFFRTISNQALGLDPKEKDYDPNVEVWFDFVDNYNPASNTHSVKIHSFYTIFADDYLADKVTFYVKSLKKQLTKTQIINLVNTHGEAVYNQAIADIEETQELKVVAWHKKGKVPGPAIGFASTDPENARAIFASLPSGTGKGLWETAGGFERFSFKDIRAAKIAAYTSNVQGFQEFSKERKEEVLIQAGNYANKEIGKIKDRESKKWIDWREENFFPTSKQEEAAEARNKPIEMAINWKNPGKKETGPWRPILTRIVTVSDKKSVGEALRELAGNLKIFIATSNEPRTVGNRAYKQKKGHLYVINNGRVEWLKPKTLGETGETERVYGLLRYYSMLEDIDPTKNEMGKLVKDQLKGILYFNYPKSKPKNYKYRMYFTHDYLVFGDDIIGKEELLRETNTAKIAKLKRFLDEKYHNIDSQLLVDSRKKNSKFEVYTVEETNKEEEPLDIKKAKIYGEEEGGYLGYLFLEEEEEGYESAKFLTNTVPKGNPQQPQYLNSSFNLHTDPSTKGRVPQATVVPIKKKAPSKKPQPQKKKTVAKGKGKGTTEDVSASEQLVGIVKDAANIVAKENRHVADSLEEANAFGGGYAKDPLGVILAAFDGETQEDLEKFLTVMENDRYVKIQYDNYTEEQRIAYFTKKYKEKFHLEEDESLPSEDDAGITIKKDFEETPGTESPNIDVQELMSPEENEEEKGTEEDPEEDPDDEGTVFRLANVERVERLLKSKELEWFVKKFPGIPVQKIAGLIQGKGYAVFKKNISILLSDMATEGTLYHEAFHVLSQVFLTSTQRAALYAEVRGRLGKKVVKLDKAFTEIDKKTGEEITTVKEIEVVGSELTNDQVEEFIAEEFRSFMLSEGKYKFPDSAPRQKGFFERAWDFLKSFFNYLRGKKNESPYTLEKIFRDLSGTYSYDLKDKKGDPVKDLYRIKRKPIKIVDPKTGETKLRKQDPFSERESLIMLKDLNYIFFQYLLSTKSERGATNLLNTDEKSLRKIYIKVLKKYDADYKEGKLRSILAKNIILNWEAIYKEHLKFLKQYGVGIKGDLLSADDLLDTPEGAVPREARNNTEWNESNKVSTKVNMPPAVKLMIAGLGLQKEHTITEAENRLRELNNDLSKINKKKVSKTFTREEKQAEIKRLKKGIDASKADLRKLQGKIIHKDTGKEIPSHEYYAMVEKNLSIADEYFVEIEPSRLFSAIKIGDYQAYSTIKFDETVNRLHNALVGLSDTKMVEKLNEMSLEYPYLHSLIKWARLETPDSQLTKDQMLIKTQFINYFNKNKNIPILTLITQDGEFVLRNAVNSTLENRLLDKWRSDVKTSDLSKTFYKRDPNTKEILIDNNKIIQLSAQEVNFSNIDISKLVPVDQYVMLKALGFELGVEYDQIPDKSILSDVGRIIEIAQPILQAGHKVSLDDIFTKEGLDVTGRIQNIANFVVEKEQDTVELQYVNQEGKTEYSITLNSHLSNTIHRLNEIAREIKTIKETSADPQKEIEAYLKTVEPILLPYSESNPNGNLYSINSDWISKIKEGKEIQLVLLRGTKPMLEKGRDSSSLSHNDFVATSFNATAQGIFPYLRAADRKLEYGFQIEGDTTDTSITPVDFARDFKKYLIDELITIGSLERLKIGENLRNYRENGKNFRFFEDILSGNLLDRYKIKIISENIDSIEKLIETTESFVESNSKTIENALLSYLEDYKEEVFLYLLDAKIISEYPLSETKLMYQVNAIDTKILETTKENDLASKRQIDKVLNVFAYNSLKANIEQTKLFTGDTAMFNRNSKNGPVEFHKRTTGAASTKKASRTGVEFNDGLDKHYPRVDGKQYDGTVNEIVYEEAEAFPEEYGELAKEADAQSRMVLDSYREMKLREGTWREQEETYQYEMQTFFLKLWKNKMNFRGVLVTKAMLRDLFGEHTGEKFSQVPMYNGKVIDTSKPLPALFPEKPQGFGNIRNVENLHATDMTKISVSPIMLSNLNPGDPMFARVLNMMENQIDMGTFISGKKGTSLVDSNGSPQPYYTEEGTPAPIKPELIQKLEYKDFGVQQDIDPKGKDQTRKATQQERLLFVDLFNLGSTTVSKSSTKTKIEKLRKERKKLSDEHTKRARASLIETLGIEKVGNKYKLIDGDVQKFRDTLIDEFNRRLLPYNVTDGINLATSSDEMLLDTLLTKDSIESVLMGLVRNKVISKKVNGYQAIQESSTGYEKEGRQWTNYKDKKTGKIKKVLTANYLKFYSKNEDGSINPMEVEISLPKKWLPWVSKLTYSKEGVSYEGIAALNKMIEDKDPSIDERLLLITGNRIPADGLHSLEAMKVKSFLPPHYGQKIILPTAIVIKAGSDFDIDKLSLYLPNVKVTKAGPRYIEFSNEALTEEKLKRIYRKDHGRLLSLFEKLEELKVHSNVAASINQAEVTKLISAIFQEDLPIIERELAEETIERFKQALELRNFSYEDYLKLKKKIGKIPTEDEFIAEFKGRPAYLVDEVKAIENRMIEISNEVILLPENYEQLLNPVAATTLKQLSEDVRPAASKQKVSYTKLMEWTYNMEVARNNWEGTRQRGQSAIAASSHSLTQIAPINIVDPLVEIFFEGQDKEKGGYKMGHVKDSLGNLISNTLGEFLSAYVDVANDPFVRFLNIGQRVFPIYNFLQRFANTRPSDVKTLVYFFTQPIIIDYIKEMEAENSLFLRAKGRGANQEEVIHRVLSKYTTKEMQEDETLINTLPSMMYYHYRALKRAETTAIRTYHLEQYNYAKRKYGQLKPSNLVSMKKRIDTGKQTKADLVLQLQILDNFLLYGEFSKNLRTFQQIARPDADIGSRRASVKIRENKIKNLKKEEFFDATDIDNHLNGTYLSEYNETQNDVVPIFRDFFLVDKYEDTIIIPGDYKDNYKGQKNLKEFLQDIMDIYGSNFGNMTQEDLYKVATSLENFLITFVLHTHPSSEWNISKNQKPQALNQQYVDLLSGSNSVAKQLQGVSKALSKYNRENNITEANYLISRLVPLVDQYLNRRGRIKKLNNIALMNLRYTTDELNSATTNYLELSESGDPKLEKFAKNLLKLSIVQSGMSPSPISYSKVLSEESFQPIAADILSSFIENTLKNPGADLKYLFQNYLVNFYKNSWGSPVIIPRKSAFKIMKSPSYDPNRYGEMVYNYRARTAALSTLDPDSRFEYIAVEGYTISNFERTKMKKKAEKAGRSFVTYPTEVFLFRKQRDAYGNFKKQGDFYIYDKVEKLGEGMHFVEIYNNPDPLSLLYYNKPAYPAQPDTTPKKTKTDEINKKSEEGKKETPPLEVDKVKKPGKKLLEKRKKDTYVGFTLEGKTTFLKKDQGKANYANAYIGYGAPGTSTASYEKSAREQGVPVNDQIDATENTVAFASVNGNNRASGAAIENTVLAAQKVIGAGGTVIMDSTTSANRSWNKSGEGVVQQRLGDPSGQTKEGYNYWGKDPLSIFKSEKPGFTAKKPTPEEAGLKSPKSKGLLSSSTKINIYAGTGENAELSNFAERSYTNPLGVSFRNVESAFQYAKTNWAEEGMNDEIRMKLQSTTGAQAKALGRKIKGLDVKVWDRNSEDIMKSIIKESFEQNPGALQKLLATGNATLTHTQDKGKWGKEFPRILMEVREELRSAPPTGEIREMPSLPEDQVPDKLSKSAQENLKERMKTLLEAMGVEYKEVEKIYSNRGKELNPVGLAKLFENVLLMVERLADERVLPEEAAHFFVSMLPVEGALRKSMMDNIMNYKVYEEVLNSEKYGTFYKGNLEAVKLEAIGKLMAQIIVEIQSGNKNLEKFSVDSLTERQRKQATTWYGQLMRIIKNLISKTVTDIFVQSAYKMLQADISDLEVGKETKEEPPAVPESTFKEDVMKLARRWNINTAGFAPATVNNHQMATEAKGLGFGLKKAATGSWFLTKNGRFFNPHLMEMPALEDMPPIPPLVPNTITLAEKKENAIDNTKEISKVKPEKASPVGTTTEATNELLTNFTHYFPQLAHYTEGERKELIKLMEDGNIKVNCKR